MFIVNIAHAYVTNSAMAAYNQILCLGAFTEEFIHGMSLLCEGTTFSLCF